MGLVEAWVLWVVSLFVDVDAVTAYINDPHACPLCDDIEAS